ncbi:MAG: hypothetical protein AAEJ53_09135, partial [Myxococcota bacterium]
AMLTTALALGPVVQNLEPRDDHAEWLAQDVWSKTASVGILGELLGIDFDPVEIPQADTPETSQLFEVLEENLRDELLPQIPDNFLQHRVRTLLRLVAKIRNNAEIGAELDALELEDMGELLEARPANLREGTRALEALVRKAGPEMDETLVRYFHRHAQREEARMRGGMGRAEDATTSPIT